MSQTSRTSGWRRQNSHSTKDLENAIVLGGFIKLKVSEEQENTAVSRVEHDAGDDNGQDQSMGEAGNVSASTESGSCTSCFLATYPGTKPRTL